VAIVWGVVTKGKKNKGQRAGEGKYGKIGNGRGGTLDTFGETDITAKCRVKAEHQYSLTSPLGYK